MTLLYFDCFSGISGDMVLGAFLDLGVPLTWLQNSLRDMPLDGLDITVDRVSRHGISANQVTVTTAENDAHRDYAHIKSLLKKARVSPFVKETALKIFEKIAQAESDIHGVSKDEIHFHEIGSLDAIVDIVGVVLCMTYLNVTQIAASRIPLGKGFVSCSHGTLPVPAPASAEILKGVPVYGTGVEQELVTPTGAAIISTIAQSFGNMPPMKIEAIGYGAGYHDNEAIPNLLRIIKGRRDLLDNDRGLDIKSEDVMLIETCIDDMNPEIYGYVMERLFDDGALDVVFIPIIMKKNRPGTMIQVLCEKNTQPAMVHRLLSETTTIGVRYHRIHRHTLTRQLIDISTPYGMVQVKKIVDPDGHMIHAPEYEACRRIALKYNIPIKNVYDEVAKIADNADE